MTPKAHYSFFSKLWKYEGKGGWHFVSFVTGISKEICSLFQWQEEGWGRMKVEAKVSGHAWETAIWFDSKSETYLLPIKADVRRKTGIKIDDTIEVEIWI